MPSIFVSNKENNIAKNEKDTGPWWKQGAMLFSEISTWIVVPVVVALIIGKKLDASYGTKPWIFIGFTMLGFLISAYGIMRSVKNYTKELEETEKNKKNNL